MLLVRHIENELSLADWYKLRDRIDFEPTYQRKGDIWGIKMKQLFINTILNEYDFPKIYLADFSAGSNVLNQNKKQFAVIDGKQRLSTIFGFFENDFLLDNTPIYFHGETAIFAGGHNFEQLQIKFPNLAKRFEDYLPTVMGVESDRIEDIYEMFIRLNINVSISGPERRNALPGPVPGIIRRIALHSFFTEKAKFVHDSKNSKDRGQDLHAAAKILSIELNGGIAVSTKKADLDSMVQKGEKLKEEDLQLYVDNSILGLDKMEAVFKFKDELLAAQTQLPTYYLFVKKYFNGSNAQQIHDFLVSFDRERRKVRKVLRSRAKGQSDTFQDQMDESLINFNSLIRSPDDKVSIESMLRIMEEAYKSLLP
jgi:hypothetical protein